MTRLPSSFRRRTSGFTLIEAMIASVVFLLGLGGLLGALVHARNATSAASRQVRAVAVATDMVTQMQLWPYDDERLEPSEGACAEDPADTAGVLTQTPRDETAYAEFVACLHGEAVFTSGGWLPTVEFPNPAPEAPTFQRYFAVRELDEAGDVVEDAHTGAHKLIWVTVTWTEGGRGRKVTTQFIHSNPRSVASLTGGGP